MLAKWINQPALCEATGWPLTRPRRVLNIRATTARKPTSLALRTEEFNPIGIQNRSQTHSRYDPRSATDHVRQGGFISGWAIDPVERGSLPSAATRTLDLGVRSPWSMKAKLKCLAGLTVFQAAKHASPNNNLHNLGITISKLVPMLRPLWEISRSFTTPLWLPCRVCVAADPLPLSVPHPGAQSADRISGD